MLRRPIVLAATVAFIQINLILAFPQYITYIIVGTLAFTVFFLPFCIKARTCTVLLVLLPTIIVCASTSYFSFTRFENTSEKLITSLQSSEDTKYTAIVDECRTYSSYSQIFVTLENSESNKFNIPLRARLNCYSGYSLEKGDKVVFQGTPISVTQIENDGFDTTNYLRSKRIFIDFPSASIIESFPSDKTSLLSELQKYTRQAISKYVRQDYDFDAAYVCYAIFAGDQNLIPKDIKDSFSECGLTHILCVSGMHLAILSAICFSLLSIFSVHKRAKCIIIIALCIFYTAFTGFSLSTVRACIVCVISYIGMMSGRKTDAYISLFFSLLVICTVSPYSVLDISLILSFCATLGIICLSEFMPLYDGNNPLLKTLCAVAGVTLSNLGAVVFTLPVCAVSFGGISLMSVVATMAVSLIFEVLLLCLLFLMLLSPLSFLAAIDIVLDFIGKICNILCSGIIKVSDFFSHFRYASITSAFPDIFALLFICLIILLSVFIAFEFSHARRFCIAAIVTLSVVFSVISLVYSIADDRAYKVTYYRKNADDRQLCIKLGTQGYLLVNADTDLCTYKDDAPFDYKYKNNYLLIVPDDKIIPSVLSKNIKIFDSRFGIKHVYIAKTKEATELASELEENGIKCHFLPSESRVGNIIIKYICDDYFYLTVDDKETKTALLFDEKYNESVFEDDCDICAFFTRETKNQFDINKDTKPKCDNFFTRIKKDVTSSGITNTFGEKTITIKG